MAEIPKQVTEAVKRRNPHLYADVTSLENPAEREVLKPAAAIDLSQRKNTDEERLNKLEKSYLAHLRALDVPNLRVQQITLKLADDCRLTCDFTYVDASGRLVFVDTKGWQREDALLKMKFAARQFTEFRFVIVTKENGLWNEMEVKP
jgi:hypothetical protein